MILKRWVIITIGIVLAVASCIIAVSIGQLWEAWNSFQRSERETLQALAQRLGTDADWDAVNVHVYCKMLYTGMQESVVKEELSKIGTYSWKRDEVLTLWVDIAFDNNILNLYLGHMQLRFDENGLLSWPAKYTPMGDPNPVECP